MKPKPTEPGSGGTLSQRAYHTVKRAIITGELAEGFFLSAEDARRRFKVGRTPFREACNRLHQERLLEVVPRRGFRVTELRFREVRDLSELRVLVESAIAELAALRGTQEQMARLRALGEKIGVAQDDGKRQRDALVSANREFHLHLAAMTQNRELELLAANLLDRAERLSYQQLSSCMVDPAELRRLHEPIVEAVLKRDPKASRLAVERDIRQGQTDVFAGFPKLA